MIGHLWRALPTPWRFALKRRYHRLRAWRDHTFLRFTPNDFRDALVSVGLVPGDAVLVHSSWTAFAGYAESPASVIRELQRLIGERGTLMMPTQPFSGSAQQYHARGTIFDAARTPSQMGVLPEVFRRMPGVVRSRHPTHSVAVWGRRAPDMIAEHLGSTTPCGFGSPYHKLLDARGKILLLGTDIGASTFNHFVEALLEPQIPFPLFTRETFGFRFTDADGTVGTVTMRLFDRDAMARRDRTLLERELARRGQLRRVTLRRLRIKCFQATDVVDITTELAHRGTYLYRPARA